MHNEPESLDIKDANKQIDRI